MLRGALPRAPKWSARLAGAPQRRLVRHVRGPGAGATAACACAPTAAIELNWKRSNLRAHQRFVEVAKQLLKDIGFPIVLSKPFGTDTPSHQCGTVRFGNDPASSALDPYCRAWDHDNLYVVDASFFPSSAALNPGADRRRPGAARRRAHLKAGCASSDHGQAVSSGAYDYIIAGGGSAGCVLAQPAERRSRDQGAAARGRRRRTAIRSSTCPRASPR